MLNIVSEPLSDSPRQVARVPDLRLRHDDSELISAVPRRGVVQPAFLLENACQAAQGAAAHQMTMRVIDLFQPIYVDQKQGDWPPRSARAFCFPIENFIQATVVG